MWTDFHRCSFLQLAYQTTYLFYFHFVVLHKWRKKLLEPSGNTRDMLIFSYIFSTAFFWAIKALGSFSRYLLGKCQECCLVPRRLSSPAVCTLPMVPCGSSPVTRFALASSAMRKTKHLRRRLSGVYPIIRKIVWWRGCVWLRYPRIRRVDRSEWLSRIRSLTGEKGTIHRRSENIRCIWRWVWSTCVVCCRGCWSGCDREARSQSWIARWIRCAAVLEGGVSYAWIDDLRHGIRYLVRDAGVIGRCTTRQHCYWIHNVYFSWGRCTLVQFLL